MTLSGACPRNMDKNTCLRSNYKWCADIPGLPPITTLPPWTPGPPEIPIDATLGDKVRGELYLAGVEVQDELMFMESTAVRRAMQRAIASLLGVDSESVIIGDILPVARRLAEEQAALRRLAVEMSVSFVVLLPPGSDALAMQNQFVNTERHDELQDYIRFELQAEGLTYTLTVTRVTAVIQPKAEDVAPQTSAPSKSTSSGSRPSASRHLLTSLLAVFCLVFSS